MAPALLLLLVALQAPAAASAPDADGDIAELKRAYADSCGQRAYGTFDDVCTQMGDQIRAREQEEARAARRAQRPARPPPPPVAGPTASSPAASPAPAGTPPAPAR